MKLLKLASVGLGRLGYEHAKNLATLLPGCTLHAICDVDEERLHTVAEELQVPCTYTDFAQMCANPDIDGVVIVSPSFLHVEQIKTAMPTASTSFVKSPWVWMSPSAWKRKKWWRPIRSSSSSWASCAALTPPMPRQKGEWTPVRSARWFWCAPIPRTLAAPSNPRSGSHLIPAASSWTCASMIWI